MSSGGKCMRTQKATKTDEQNKKKDWKLMQIGIQLAGDLELLNN